MENVIAIDAMCTESIQRLSFGKLDYLVLPGATMFGWLGIGPSLMGVFAIGGRPAFYTATLSLALGQILNRALKVFFQRPRPIAPTGVPRAVSVKVPSMESADGASFPSGDTMAASAVGAALAIVLSQNSGTSSGWPWLLLGFYAGFARIFFWCHFVSDCLSGYIVGTISVIAISSLSNQGQSLEWWQVLISAPPFIAIMKALKKLQLSRAKDS
eukprot:TRINITY_DN38601_c0_g1_i1.p1 TRINITY_DN38601_c0_g1~~TRINITY_DN38601_c0_g1_i1.p1  ORF type:complete len:214 (+),score=30.14 TRINITY_DN38601_c0_g1_i1:52-693(+)